MKKINLIGIILLLLITASVQAQTTVVSGLKNPRSILLNGNDLYVAEFQGNKVSKIDISSPTPTAIDVVTGLNYPVGLLLNGNDLYITEYTGKLLKVDITSPFPRTATDVVIGLSNPYGLFLNGNDLYIAESGGTKISKIDITSSAPTVTTVVTGLSSPQSIILNGNDLYIAESGGNKISKIDITSPFPRTATDVVTGLDRPYFMVLDCSDLYISESSGNKISKFNLTTKVLTDVVTGLASPIGILLNGNELHISENGGGKISKFSIIHYVDTRMECDSLLWIDGNTYYANNTNAQHNLTNVLGCDSVVALDLTINSVSDITTTSSGASITANNANATYQWLDCDGNFSAINGETNRSFTALSNGNYAVELTENGCIDTSACVTVTSLSVHELENNVSISAYPNPTKESVHVALDRAIKGVDLILTDITGKEIFNKHFNSLSETDIVIDGKKGVYLLTIKTANDQEVLNLVKD